MTSQSVLSFGAEPLPCFRVSGCMDLATGRKLQNMLEQKAKHGVLITIMPFT